MRSQTLCALTHHQIVFFTLRTLIFTSSPRGTIEFAVEFVPRTVPDPLHTENVQRQCTTHVHNGIIAQDAHATSRTVDCSPPIRSIHLSSKVPQPIRFSHLDPHVAEVLKIWLGKSRSALHEQHTWRQDARPAARKVNMMGAPWDGFTKMALFVLALK